MMTAHLSMPRGTGTRSTVAIAPALTSGLPAGMTCFSSDGMFLNRSMARIELNFCPVALTPMRLFTTSGPAVSMARATVNGLLTDWIENSSRAAPIS